MSNHISVRKIFIGILLIVAAGVAVQLETGNLLAKTTGQSVMSVIESALPGEIIGEKTTKRLQGRLSRTGLKEGTATFIRIFKQEAELEVWLADDTTYLKLHTYPICNFSGFLGPKLKEGDKQSPEGFYVVSAKQLNPNSTYYRSFNLGFPNAYDKAHGRTGSYLMVHGNCVSIGCYAMTNEGISEIYQLVESALAAGQNSVPVHIFPFRMSEANIAEHGDGPWRNFWTNLKTGYELFEKNRIPPAVGVSGKRYVFDGDIPDGASISGW